MDFVERARLWRDTSKRLKPLSQACTERNLGERWDGKVVEVLLSLERNTMGFGTWKGMKLQLWMLCCAVQLDDELVEASESPRREFGPVGSVK